jgi:mono/diheme cytochrome c family protein
MFSKRIRSVGVGLFSLALGAALLHGETPLERGKYLVENAAICSECHTPHLNGKPDASKQLKGSTLEFQPSGEIPHWHKTAPDISSTSALFQRWGDDGFKKFLETGLNPRGGSADPPMPQYRFTPEDASAIVQYLKTVK